MSADMRIGDAEREAAITALGEHFAAGRIDKDEYDERSAVAWSARTSAALTPLFADLPKPHGTPPSASDTSGEPPQWRSASTRSRRPGRQWMHIARVVLVPVVIALAVLSLIPWFVVAATIWLAWMGLTRCAWGPRRQWHRGAAAYGGRSRW